MHEKCERALCYNGSTSQLGRIIGCTTVQVRVLPGPRIRPSRPPEPSSLGELSTACNGVGEKVYPPSSPVPQTPGASQWTPCASQALNVCAVTHITTYISVGFGQKYIMEAPEGLRGPSLSFTPLHATNYEDEYFKTRPLRTFGFKHTTKTTVYDLHKSNQQKKRMPYEQKRSNLQSAEPFRKNTANAQ